MSGVPGRPEDAGSHVVDEHKEDTSEVDAQIGSGIRHQLRRCVHHREKARRQTEAEYPDNDTARYGKCICSVQALLQRMFVLSPVKLCDDNGSAGGKAGKKADDQIDDLCGRASHACKGLFSYKVPYNDRVYSII